MIDKNESFSSDKLIAQFDRALRTLVPGASQPRRFSPASGVDNEELDSSTRQHAAGLMRINHTGEVCAQALYQGQALTARLGEVRDKMENAAREEIDHLGWCEDRLDELDSRPSILNPVWYGLSFGLGATAGLAGDRWSLGFVAETEKQVCEHLQEHLKELPDQDHKSRAVLEQMVIDEAQHADDARNAGGIDLPSPVRGAMKFMATVMKSAVYRI